ncbi:hypothetical protein F5J12DRAFT_818248 [Pisolithus orientalis]|uniref:uncharacterized protein n=1 Tax=Pisolithus orientalis TaxID=936130 RepID=UPI00222549AE|nr:uncharacterized protein F5J12DRAFT_818248 [Pisolithus orientalis]KAI6012481.1 hypothetical protein F5J12DRAFT_818248 [Pisolithus orientalis]
MPLSSYQTSTVSSGETTMSTPQSPEELLASLGSMSKRILVCTKSSLDTLPVTANRNPNVLLEPIRVAKPPPIFARLLEAGAPQHLAQEMHTIYLDRAKKFRTRFTALISRLRQDLSRLPTDDIDTFDDQLTPLFLGMYTKALQDWAREGVDMFRRRRLPDHKRPFNRIFNHDYVPLLEHFFDENPFPTHADKAFLARKSGMSYQQIHVWFQNRRSRYRKVGKVLRKRTMSEGTALSPNSPAVRMDNWVTKPGEATVDENCSDKEAKQSDPLDQPRDQCPVISCSTQAEIEFNPSWWPRRPSLVNPRQSFIDMEGLVEKFSQLSVRDRTGGRGKKHQAGLCYSPAATSSVTVVPTPAPLPALIRRGDVSLPPLPPLIVPRTSASRSTRLRAFNSHQLPNLLAPSVVSDFPESPHKKRKVISEDSFLGATSFVCERLSMAECDVASSRVPQVTPHSIPTLSTNTTPRHVLQTNGSLPWVFPIGRRGLSKYATPPWGFLPALTV